MRRIPPFALELARVRTGPIWSLPSDGMNGLFILPGPCGADLRIICSNGDDWPFPPPVWEHASVSIAHRIPNWKEMEFARELVFDETDLVLQFSVPRQDHINVHPYCLHLWRPIGVTIPLPPPATVG
jgi:hypothetical protein